MHAQDNCIKRHAFMFAFPYTVPCPYCVPNSSAPVCAGIFPIHDAALYQISPILGVHNAAETVTGRRA